MATELTTNNIKIFSYMTGCMEHESITPTEFMVLSELIGFINPETCFFEEPSSNGRISYASSIYDLVDKLEHKFNHTRAKAYRYIKRLIDKDIVIAYDANEGYDRFFVNPYLLHNYMIVEKNKALANMIDYLRSTVWYDYNIEVTAKVYSNQ